VTVFF